MARAIPSGNITAHIVIVHASPYEGSPVTLCCGRTPFELDRFDRMTPWLADVTCGMLEGEQE
jgi:hypothetical protein